MYLASLSFMRKHAGVIKKNLLLASINLNLSKDQESSKAKKIAGQQAE
jgi:hypothetical protein